MVGNRRKRCLAVISHHVRCSDYFLAGRLFLLDGLASHRLQVACWAACGPATGGSRPGVPPNLALLPSAQKLDGGASCVRRRLRGRFVTTGRPQLVRAAEMHYRLALKFDPDNPTALFNLGVALEAEARPARP